MNYKYLTPDQQDEIIRGVLVQAEADHLRHTLNAEAATLAGDNDRAALELGLAVVAEARVSAVERDYPASIERAVIEVVPSRDR